MKKRSVIYLYAGVLALLTGLVLPVSGMSQEVQKMGGWEFGSEYDKHYDATELDKIRVDVIKVTEVVPMEGMAPGAGLVVRERGSDEDIIIHIAPVSFIKPSETGISKGDRLKIRGCWAEIDGEDVFMASKIKKGDYFVLKVRLTKDGFPFWSMSPQQLAAERASQ